MTPRRPIRDQAHREDFLFWLNPDAFDRLPPVPSYWSLVPPLAVAVLMWLALMALIFAGAAR